MNTPRRIPPYVRKLAKVVLWTIGSVVALLLVCILIVRIPAVQRKIVSKAQDYLSELLHTDVRIGSVYLSFPKVVKVNQLYVEDQKQDTLLFIDELGVDTDLWGLTRRTIELNTIHIDGLKAKVLRPRGDSVFNYQFIIDAFASGEKDSIESSEPWKFVLGNVQLLDFNLGYHDEPSALELDAAWQEIEIKMDEFDLEKSVIHAKSLDLQGVDFRMSAGSEPSPAGDAPADTAATFPFDIQAGKINITESSVVIDAEAMNLDADIGNLELTTNLLDLAHNRVDARRLHAERMAIRLDLPSPDTTSIDTMNAPAPSTQSWTVKLSSLNFGESQFIMNVGPSDSTSGAFDPQHLRLSNISLSASDLFYNADSTMATVDDASVDAGNLTIASLSAEYQSTPRGMRVNDLNLETGRSSITGSAEMVFGTTTSIKDSDTRVALLLRQTTIALRDVAFFYPPIDSIVNVPPGTVARVTANASGTLSDIHMKQFELAMLNDSRVILTGSLKGLPDADRLTYSLDTLSVSTSKQDASVFLPDSLLADTVYIPQQVQVTAKGTGTKQSFTGLISLLSSSGNLDARINRFALQDTVPHYDVTLRSESIDAGSFIGQPDELNGLAFTLDAKGRGFALDSLTAANIKGHLRHIDYNDHIYDTLHIDANLQDNLLTGNISMDDDGLTFDFKGQRTPQGGSERYKVKLDVERADLKALNASRTPLTIGAELDADIAVENDRRLNGNIAIHKFTANDSIHTYRVDSLLFASISKEGETDITISSDIMEGSLKGDIDILKLPQVIRQHINQYYAINGEKVVGTDEMNFEFDLRLKNTDLLTEVFVPQLDQFKPGKISASYDGASDALKVDVNVLEFTYAGIEVDTLRLFAESDKEQMTAALSINSIASSNTAVKNLRVSGTLADSTIITRLSIRDSVAGLKYLVKGNLRSANGITRFRLQPDSLVLAYEQWSVNDDNYVQFGGEQGTSNNIMISNNGQQLHVQTLSEADSILRISFTNFKLESIGKAISKEQDFVKGNVNGAVDILMPPHDAGVSGKLTINGLEYVGQPWGNFSADVKQQGKIYDVNVTLKSSRNDVAVKGTYTAGSDNPFNASMRIASLDLATIEPLSTPAVVDMKGTLQGELSVRGSLTQPLLDGSISLKEAHFNPTSLNNPLYVADETISFKKSVISFDNFELEDEKKNTATLNGSVTMRETDYYELNLRVRTRDFLVLNTTRQKDRPFYGTLRTNGTVRIRGTSVRPDITMNMKVSEGSALTYEVPKSEYQVLNQSNIVEFVSHDSAAAPAKTLIADTTIFEGINLSAKLEVDDQSTFTIVIDPLTNDQLVVKGEATLNVDMTAKGDLRLAGRYTLSEGKYTFSFYKLVKREFNIQKGSSITWTGDPVEGVMDIRATHLVEAPPIDLVASQISTNDAQTLNKYRQRLPFLVDLNIKGKLLQPEISFELDMPVDKRNAINGSVYAKLQEVNSREADLNKQVFALLILQRFVSDNPLQSEGSNLEDNVRRSVSRILSDQLNKLADDINGIDLNLDLKSYEDFSTGSAQGTTQLELGVTQSLFDERLTVKVSGNVNIEGQKQQDVSDYVGDLILEYKLTDDGRLRIQGFRKSDYDLLSGEIIETGAGIIFVRDYNAFRELFRKSEKEK